MTEATKKEIISVINSKIGGLECPMCHQKQFTLVDGCFANVVQDNLPKIKLDGTFIPTISIICSHCGFVSQHAAGILGIQVVASNIEQKK